jgi:hypothetical protein
MPRIVEYNERFGALDGWFNDQSAYVWDCLLDFQQMRGIEGPLYEIGVFRGKSAAMCCLHAKKQEHVVLVDPYRPDEVKATLAAAKNDNLIFFPCRSAALPPAAINPYIGQCRWIHIDGDHTGHSCTLDLNLANSLLGDQGIIVVDDFLSPAYPNLTAAVFIYLYNNPFALRLFLCGFNKGYLVRPRSCRMYLEYVRDGLQNDLRARNYGEKITILKKTLPDDLNCFGMTPYVGRDALGLFWDPDEILI